ncbi:hypothetical protein BDZ89DRAFT_958506 [Hymenopellis radicata]|nr:hypothetical protein BDZ89DRAFT_958506 [Hymenopellis radicata]
MPHRYHVGISCKTVGIGPDGTVKMLAYVTILVNSRGQRILERYVEPTWQPVTKYDTERTGIEAHHLIGGERSSSICAYSHGGQAKPFDEVQQEVSNAIRGRTLVGHSLWRSLSVLGIRHPVVDTRDVALYVPFRNTLNNPSAGRLIIGLRSLVQDLLERQMPPGIISTHDSARYAMELYRLDCTQWELHISNGIPPCALPPSSFSTCYT